MISDLHSEKSDCPWILEHPWQKPSVQLAILTAIVFFSGMIVGKVCL